MIVRNWDEAVSELLLRNRLFKRNYTQQDKIVVTGPYALNAIYNDVHLVEDFTVRIVVSADYPYSLPSIWETSGTIDPKYEHLNKDESFCLGVHGELLLEQLEHPSLISFLEGPVRSYLYTYVFHKIYNRYPFGDRPHGVKGTLQYYGEIFDEQKPLKIAKLLESVLYLAPMRIWTQSTKLPRQHLTQANKKQCNVCAEI